MALVQILSTTSNVTEIPTERRDPIEKNVSASKSNFYRSSGCQNRCSVDVEGGLDERIALASESL